MIALDLYDSMDAELAEPPVLYTAAQRARHQEIQIARLRAKMAAMQAAIDEIKGRPAVIMVAPVASASRSRRRPARRIRYWHIMAGITLVCIAGFYLVMRG